MIVPRLELGTFCVLDRCDNHYTIRSDILVISMLNELKISLIYIYISIRTTYTLKNKFIIHIKEILNKEKKKLKEF
jgi:hypothetical protein